MTTCQASVNSAEFGAGGLKHLDLFLVRSFEAGSLFVAADTGFPEGPAVVASMAADSWVPHKFRVPSTRLVTQNGILMMGCAALGILFRRRTSITRLVVLYAVPVILTCAMSLFGLCVYW